MKPGIIPFNRLIKDRKYGLDMDRNNHKWEYDPGERRNKHKWDSDQPGFVPLDEKNAIGKCPNTITNSPGLAERLLNEGVAYPPNMSVPDEIFNVYQGVVYRAKPTVPGKSYHGFPEKEGKGRKIALEVLAELDKRAKRDGMYPEFENWMKKYLPEGWKRLFKTRLKRRARDDEPPGF
ncbi:MAG: hypothetical protein HQL65_09115 [Magnetococcales bacterium]|nr:hypothetical protein [Magnetococcales bacterium]